MKKLIVILILLIFLNCKSDKKEVYREYNGEIVKVEFYESKGDSSFSGYGASYYPNGILESITKFKNGEPIDTLFYYYENGNIKEKGLLKNGLQNGWWTYYNENGTLKEKIDWIAKGNNTIYKNQILVFDKKGNLKPEPSTYFELSIPDTLIVGRNISFVKNYVSNFGKVHNRFLSVIVENRYEDNTVKIDTFSDGTLKPFFGIYGYKPGKQIVKGKIEEKILKTNKIGNDSASLTIIDHYKFFEFELYVAEKEQISEKSKKIIDDYFNTKENN